MICLADHYSWPMACSTILLSWNLHEPSFCTCFEILMTEKASSVYHIVVILLLGLVKHVTIVENGKSEFHQIPLRKCIEAYKKNIYLWVVFLSNFLKFYWFLSRPLEILALNKPIEIWALVDRLARSRLYIADSGYIAFGEYQNG